MENMTKILLLGYIIQGMHTPTLVPCENKHTRESFGFWLLSSVYSQSTVPVLPPSAEAKSQSIEYLIHKHHGDLGLSLYRTTVEAVHNVDHQARFEYSISDSTLNSLIIYHEKSLQEADMDWLQGKVFGWSFSKSPLSTSGKTILHFKPH